MAVRQFDAVAEIQSAFQILVKNWMLAVPTAIASLLATIYAFMVFASILAAVGFGTMAGMPGIGNVLGAFTGLAGIGALVIVFVSIIATAMVMASAEDAWAGRGVDLSKSFGRALACLVQMIIAGIVVGLMLAVATIIPFLGWIVVGYLMMYVMPAVIVGNAGAIDAIGQSFNLTTKNFAASAVGFIGIVLALVVGGIANSLFGHIFGVNFIVGLIVGGFTSAFGALVAVRFYDLLRTGAPAIAP